MSKPWQLKLDSDNIELIRFSSTQFEMFLKNPNLFKTNLNLVFYTKRSLREVKTVIRKLLKIIKHNRSKYIDYVFWMAVDKRERNVAGIYPYINSADRGFNISVLHLSKESFLNTGYVGETIKRLLVWVLENNEVYGLSDTVGSKHKNYPGSLKQTGVARFKRRSRQTA